MDIIAWVVLGLIAGAIAKAIYPGHQSGGILGTMQLNRNYGPWRCCGISIPTVARCRPWNLILCRHSRILMAFAITTTGYEIC